MAWVEEFEDAYSDLYKQVFVDMLQQMGYDPKETMDKIKRMDIFPEIVPNIVSQYLNVFTEAVYFPKRVIILADRLYGTGLILQYYLTECCGTNVMRVASNANEVLQTTQTDIPDALILVGSQQNSDNYRAIHELRQRKPSPQIAMWGNVDYLIKEICYKYDITRIADRRQPIQELVHCLL